MATWIEQFMTDLGYLGIVLLMVLENLFPPLPSELILPAAGFASARGDLHLLGVIAAAALGSVLGTLPLYYLGRAYGEDRLIRWADKHGKWLTLTGRDIRKADDWFDRHGNKAVLFGRMVPGIRSLLSLPAGVSQMPLPKFLVYSALGSGVWAAVLVLLGYWLGDNYDQVEHWVAPLGKVVVLGAALVLGAWWWRRRASEQPRT